MQSQQITPTVLVSLYERILRSLGYHDAGGGLLSEGKGVDAQPLMIGEMRCVLPNDNFLRMGGINQIAFHPLCESATRAESRVINKLRNMINAKLSELIGVLALFLMELAVDQTRHSQMSPEQQELLKLLPDVNKNTLDSLIQIINAMNPVGEHRFVNVFLKRKGTLNGVAYYRTAIVNFPILQNDDPKDLTIFNVKLKSQKDKKAIILLFKYILGQVPEPQDFSVGSASGTAPFFHALVNAYGKLARWLNETLFDYRNHISCFKDVFISDLDWLEDVRELNQYRDLIPPLPGNEGELLEGMETQAQLQQPLGMTVATVTSTDLEAERARRSGFNVGGKKVPTLGTGIATNPNPGLQLNGQVQVADEVLAFTQSMAKANEEYNNRFALNTPYGREVYNPHDRESVLRARNGQLGSQPHQVGVSSGIVNPQQRGRGGLSI